jgi:hypothetical protein
VGIRSALPGIRVREGGAEIVADQPNRFLARTLERSEDLRVRANVAVEQARHLRLSNRRLRRPSRPVIVDELTEARLRRALSASS